MPCRHLVTEIWYNILNHVDDYITLKKCGRVCKELRSITDHKDFDDVLFRGQKLEVNMSSSRDVLPSEDYIVHPALENITFKRTKGTDTYGLLEAFKCNADSQAHDYWWRASNELAILPPQSAIWFTEQGSDELWEIYGEHGKAVTIDNVIVALLDNLEGDYEEILLELIYDQWERHIAGHGFMFCYRHSSRILGVFEIKNEMGNGIRELLDEDDANQLYDSDEQYLSRIMSSDEICQWETQDWTKTFEDGIPPWVFGE